MKNLKKFLKLTCWIFIGFLFFPITESKAQLADMSASDLTKASTAVLYGKCTKKRCEWNENKSIIYTYVTVVPEEYIKGNLGAEAVIAIPGGQVGDVIYEVSDMPMFTEGEDVMAFIWTNPSGKNLITGGSHGKMKIEKDLKTGKRMVQGIGTLDNTDVQNQAKGQVKKAEKMQLEDFVVKLKGYAKN